MTKWRGFIEGIFHLSTPFHAALTYLVKRIHVAFRNLFLLSYKNAHELSLTRNLKTVISLTFDVEKNLELVDVFDNYALFTN